MKRYPWETSHEASLRRLGYLIDEYTPYDPRRPLGRRSLSTPNPSPVAMPGWKQESADAVASN
jgi:hypothetical protein